MKLMRILKDGIVLKVLNVKEELSENNVPESNMKNELGVMLVADLQEKQNTESRAVENILAEKVPHLNCLVYSVSHEWKCNFGYRTTSSVVVLRIGSPFPTDLVSCLSLGEFVRANREKSNLIGWRQTLTTSPANHIRFLLVRAKKSPSVKRALAAWH